MIAPTVSVIIPNYNHGEFLKQRIESVLNQTFKGFEVIILDDCSSDSSREIIADYAHHPSVREVVLNDENSGSPFKQWQRGISLSRGEWIWIAESDDYADERFLEILIAALGGRPNVGLAYCDSNPIGNASKGVTFASIKNSKFNTDRWSRNYFNEGPREVEDYLLPGGTINNTSAVLFNKQVLIDADPFDAELRYIGDKYAFVKVLARSNVVYVKDSLNYFRSPFNTKNADKFVFYFYEQFIVFNWAYRNLKITSRKNFLRGFYLNTRSSVFRGWDRTKFSLYRKLFKMNKYLLMKSVISNVLFSLSASRELYPDQEPSSR